MVVVVCTCSGVGRSSSSSGSIITPRLQSVTSVAIFIWYNSVLMCWLQQPKYLIEELARDQGHTMPSIQVTM